MRDDDNDDDDHDDGSDDGDDYNNDHDDGSDDDDDNDDHDDGSDDDDDDGHDDGSDDDDGSDNGDTDKCFDHYTYSHCYFDSLHLNQSANLIVIEGVDERDKYIRYVIHFIRTFTIIITTQNTRNDKSIIDISFQINP